ncbi:hypothetical protein [Leuconostoc pseudomesenteroides]
MDNRELKKDIAKSVGRTIWSLVPFVGAPTQLFVSDFFTERRFDNINKFNTELLTKLDKLEVDINNIDTSSDNLSEIVESVYEEIQKTKSNKKRAMFATALANSLKITDDNSLESGKDFVNILTIIPYPYVSTLAELRDGMLTYENIPSDCAFLNAYGLID